MSSQKPTSPRKQLDRLRRLSRILDDALPIPGTPYRIGLDPILGIIPGGGDTITGALGAYIVVEAARMGLPPRIIGQMVINIIFDSVAGTIPVLGDLFDIGWKANVRNLALLETHLQINQKIRKNNLFFLMGLILLLTVIILGFAALTVFLVRWLWNAIG